jgi:hypothetical protein
MTELESTQMVRINPELKRARQTTFNRQRSKCNGKCKSGTTANGMGPSITQIANNYSFLKSYTVRVARSMLLSCCPYLSHSTIRSYLSGHRYQRYWTVGLRDTDPCTIFLKCSCTDGRIMLM